MTDPRLPDHGPLPLGARVGSSKLLAELLDVDARVARDAVKHSALELSVHRHADEVWRRDGRGGVGCRAQENRSGYGKSASVVVSSARGWLGGGAIKEFCMLQASTPEDVCRLIGQAITSGDMDAALSLYEPDATFAMPRGFGEGSVTGLDGLREAFGAFLAMGPELTVNAERTLHSGDTALVIGNWTLKGRDADGKDIDASGRYADVVRRQPDGSWRYVIDNPNGSD